MLFHLLFCVITALEVYGKRIHSMEFDKLKVDDRRDLPSRKNDDRTTNLGKSRPKLINSSAVTQPKIHVKLNV